VTVTHDAQRAAVPTARGSSLQEPVWTLPALFDPRGRRERKEVSPVRYDREGLKQATLEARIALEEVAVAAAVAAQRALTVAEVLDEALAILEQTGGDIVTSPQVHEAVIATETLSPREREVLALVAQGRTNKAIAETLFVSPNTIKTHVASLLNKLHAETRVQLAAMAARTAMR
jgi:DNA-binding NarL/FixJ family response regulator